MTTYLKISELTDKQKEFILHNLELSTPARDLLANGRYILQAYLFYHDTVKELWWTSEPTGNIEPFDKFIQPFQNQLLMDML